MSTPPALASHTWIVIPTYDERENLASLVGSVLDVVPDVRLLIVDDNSPDGTGVLADEIAQADPRVSVMHRAGKEGLGAAYRAGFLHVLQNPECTRVIQMDCDFSHSPHQVPLLLDALDAGNDLVLGSRYVPGGSTPGWGFRRRMISKAGSLVARWILRLPQRDLTGGFKAWRRALLDKIDLERGYAQGYGFQIEMTWKAHQLGAQIAEVPIAFHDRVAGTSKMTGAIAAEALLMVIRLRLRGAPPSVAGQPATSRLRS